MDKNRSHCVQKSATSLRLAGFDKHLQLLYRDTKNKALCRKDPRRILGGQPIGYRADMCPAAVVVLPLRGSSALRDTRRSVEGGGSQGRLPAVTRRSPGISRTDLGMSHSEGGKRTQACL